MQTEIMPSVQNKLILKQDCSYQGKALNVPIAFSGLSSSSNIKKLSIIKK